MTSADLPPAAVFRVSSGGVSDAGLVRPHNEDSYLAATPAFLVADGMGGHTGGAAASAAVVRAFEHLAGRPWASAADVQSAVARAATEVSAVAGEGPPPGSTLAGVALTEQDGHPCWLVFNVGDSRVYLLRDGRLEQVTVDHSRRQELLDAGAPPESIQVGRNVITRALGAGQVGAPAVDLWLVPAAAGDRVLVCSDGLSAEVTEVLLLAVLQSVADPLDASRALLAAALDAGGRDNVTAVVVDALEVTGAVFADAEDTLTSGVVADHADDDTVDLTEALRAVRKE